MINIDLHFGGLNGAAAPANQRSQLSSLSAQSFTTFLSEALSETLSKFGIDPNNFQLTLTNQPSQTPAASPNLATSAATSPPEPPTAPSATAAIPATASLTPFAPVPGTVNLVPVAATAAADTQSVAPSSDSSSQTWYASTPADDAYWSAQPAAVQQLRGIDNLDERKQLGEQLANEGYAIDVPIMVWGWDAGKVTAARESYGYKWVPSALQQPVSAAPGVTGGGVIPYNSSHPPSGSIQV